MVHGSEVSVNPGRVNLSSKGENAVKLLDNHPVVQAARAAILRFVPFFTGLSAVFK